jgi:L,D-peptidoglycan transpeptidase YkuD (ErfK/YbiS/YcfS/YnhG family)
MRITVTANGPGESRGLLNWQGREVPCALGRAGITDHKSEGDGATPVGLFALRRALYRSDRMAPPPTALPLAAITPHDGWCDDDTHPAYNTQVTLPAGARAEPLWREDALYDLLVVLGHNDAPPIAGRGSAIFLHVAGPGLAATEGCIAIAAEALVALVAAAAPDDDLEIRAL